MTAEDDDEVELQGSSSFILSNYRILDKANDKQQPQTRLWFNQVFTPTKISILNVFGKFLVGLARKNHTSLLERKEETLLDYRILEVDIHLILGSWESSSSASLDTTLALTFVAPVTTFLGTLFKVITIGRLKRIFSLSSLLPASNLSLVVLIVTADLTTISDSWKIWIRRTCPKGFRSPRRKCSLFSMWESRFLIHTEKSSWLVRGSGICVSRVTVSESSEISLSSSSILTTVVLQQPIQFEKLDFLHQ